MALFSLFANANNNLYKELGVAKIANEVRDLIELGGRC